MSFAKVKLTVANARIETATGSSGQFCFNHLEPNKYELVVQAHSFHSEHRKLVVLLDESFHLTMAWQSNQSHNKIKAPEGSADTGSLNVALSSILTLTSPAAALFSATNYTGGTLRPLLANYQARGLKMPRTGAFIDSSYF
jgi:hypothetical protein